MLTVESKSVRKNWRAEKCIGFCASLCKNNSKRMWQTDRSLTTTKQGKAISARQDKAVLARTNQANHVQRHKQLLTDGRNTVPIFVAARPNKIVSWDSEEVETVVIH